MTIEAELINEQGKTIAYTKKTISNFLGFPMTTGSNSKYVNNLSYHVYTTLVALPAQDTITFDRVNGNDITDHLTVAITSVNGIDAETAGRTGYIKISSGDTKVDYSPYIRTLRRFENSKSPFLSR
jgi:hypothetical protein